MTDGPIILWLRRDLRLTDNPALRAAADSGRPVIPVFIRDETVDNLGAAAKWRLGLSLENLAGRIDKAGARLILRSGPALDALKALAGETGATTILWSRYYDAPAVRRDKAVKDWARGEGLDARSYKAHLLFEPWEVATGQGGPYKVYTPFWRAVNDREVPPPLPEVRKIDGPDRWPESETLTSWRLGAAMRRGAAVVAKHARPGERAALERLDAFIEDAIGGYDADRDRLDLDGCSGLSEHLAWGEISPRTVWHAAIRAREEGARGAVAFLREIIWREFAWHLFYHAPDMAERNWRLEWNGFAWRRDNADAERWRQGRTGEPVVDAAMRQMFVTGTMHNRARMIVASYLTKHLLTDWRVGLKWFEDCLIDWDPASNAMGWQWVAGSGPDAAPFFRVFNPATQAEKFDPRGEYRRRWIAEGAAKPTETALSYFDAVPKSWALDPEMPGPGQLIDLAEGRKRALAAYERHK